MQIIDKVAFALGCIVAGLSLAVVTMVVVIGVVTL